MLLGDCAQKLVGVIPKAPLICIIGPRPTVLVESYASTIISRSPLAVLASKLLCERWCICLAPISLLRAFESIAKCPRGTSTGANVCGDQITLTDAQWRHRRCDLPQGLPVTEAPATSLHACPNRFLPGTRSLRPAPSRSTHTAASPPEAVASSPSRRPPLTLCPQLVALPPAPRLPLLSLAPLLTPNMPLEVLTSTTRRVIWRLVSSPSLAIALRALAGRILRERMPFVPLGAHRAQLSFLTATTGSLRTNHEAPFLSISLFCSRTICPARFTSHLTRPFSSVTRAHFGRRTSVTSTLTSDLRTSASKEREPLTLRPSPIAMHGPKWRWRMPIVMARDSKAAEFACERAEGTHSIGRPPAAASLPHVACSILYLIFSHSARIMIQSHRGATPRPPYAPLLSTSSQRAIVECIDVRIVPSTRLGY
ncbi:hypothetical protein K438DRAFT_1969645 [Mycena galopus ATCC 62051]|nr:hypothetical protein K438DRAFT_1969645 [Mycena galopus ATCC 62051]